MIALLGQSIIDGTTLDDWFFAIVAIAVGLTTLAALAHKPPVKQLGRGIGWVFGRLIGEPVAAWYERNFTTHAEPIVIAAVEKAVEKAVVPVKEEVAGLRAELRTHVEEAKAAAEVATEWRAGVEQSFRNLQQSQAPHLGGRASEPDPVKE